MTPLPKRPFHSPGQIVPFADGQPAVGQESGNLLSAGYSLVSLKYPKIRLSTDISERYNLVKYFSNNKINSEKCDHIVYETSGDLHKMREMIKTCESTPDKFTNDNFQDVLNTHSPDINMRVLDYLEIAPTHISKNVKHRAMSKILQMFVFSDNYETFINRELLWECQSRVYEIRCNVLKLYIHSQISTPTKGNRYISKSLTHISAINQSSDLYECIHPSIYTQIYQNLTNINEISKLFEELSIPKRYRKLLLKTVAYFYKTNIPAKLFL